MSTRFYAAHLMLRQVDKQSSQKIAVLEKSAECTKNLIIAPEANQRLHFLVDKKLFKNLI
jgi:hypothetical protein